MSKLTQRLEHRGALPAESPNIRRGPHRIPCGILRPLVSETQRLPQSNHSEPWMYELIKEKKILVHAYTFYNEEQLNEYFDKVDGFFTDQVKKIEYTLKNKYNLDNPNFTNEKTESQILDELGY